MASPDLVPKSTSDTEPTQLRSFLVRNYKSLVDVNIELGRFNVFIGENGCGKSNLLESLGVVAAALADRLSNEDLYARGVRIARPSLTLSAFKQGAPLHRMEFTSIVAPTPTSRSSPAKLTLWETNGDWKSDYVEKKLDEDEWLLAFVRAMDQKTNGEFSRNPLAKKEIERILFSLYSERHRLGLEGGFPWLLVEEHFRDFGIYSPSTLVLRGLQTESRREPLGLFGEGLDVAISKLPLKSRRQLNEYAQLVSWVDRIELDKEGKHQGKGYKPGRSISELFFKDKFMAKNNCIFSAENANEGVLHVLFYLVLFMSPRTPVFFAIDNIETSLNPRLLRHLIKLLAQLATDHNKQVLITTHNPATLDGLNLNDDNQRLFEVYRSDEGHTKIRRIKTKPEQYDEKLKLSEMWMRGILGAIPQHF